MRSARDAEKRQAKLDDIDRQVADGSLTIRTLSDAEKRRFGIADPDKPYRRFFFPGAKPTKKSRTPASSPPAPTGPAGAASSSTRSFRGPSARRPARCPRPGGS